MEVYALKLDREVSLEEIDIICSKLPIERQKKIRAFIRSDDALRSAAAGLLLQRLAGKELGWSTDKLVFSRDHHGRPFLPGSDGFHFNLSHSGEWVTAVVDRSPVGIDIQHVRPIDLGIAHGYFTPAECRSLWSQPADRRESFFFQLWTLKESYLKMLGTGLSRPLDSFSVDIRSDGTFDLDDPQDLGEVYLKPYPIDPRYRLSVCARSHRFPPAVSLLDWHTLIQEAL